jgi:chloramphenicol-sensitive protein RarD
LAVAAQVTWGLFPFYWKQIQDVPALQVIAHRILWSFVTLALIGLWLGTGRKLRDSLRSGRVLGLYAIAAVLISANWFAYIWAVNNGLIVETSLGYFINPLVTVLLGVVFFGERLRAAQWLAVSCAAAGVAYLTLAHGSLPWIALALAATFSAYSAVKKLAPLDALGGLTVETGWVTLPALGFLAFQNHTGAGAFYHAGLGTSLYLAGAGLVTTIPLILFAGAVRKIPLTLIGVSQYISPTLQLIIGVLFYHEPFTPEQAIGFSGVWAGLIVFWVDSWIARPR